MCVIMTCLCLFDSYINYIYYTPGIVCIKVLVFLCAIIMLVGTLMNRANKKKQHGATDEHILPPDIPFKIRFYLNSFSIIERTFIWYFIIYTLLDLNTISVAFTYIMILLCGIYGGHKIANMTELYHIGRYKKEKEENITSNNRQRGKSIKKVTNCI